MEIVNGKKLLRQLYEAREQKVLHMAANRARTGSSLVDTSKLLENERHLFERVLKVLQEIRLQQYIEEEKKIEAPPTTLPNPVASDVIQVRFVKAVPQFLGKNMETYGPYDEQQKVDLPTGVAELLIRKGAAVQESAE
jgi:hypothetical protein